MYDSTSPASQPPRRDFLKKALAVVIGGIVSVVPAAAGLLVWLDPLRRAGKGGDAAFVPVTSLGAVPSDNTPRKFQVITDRVDAWTKTPDVPIGAVFLKRSPEGKVTAWNVVCPHAGCFIDVIADPATPFRCPCHNSTFRADGSIDPGKCVSPRGMDELEVDEAALAQGMVQVRFQNFIAGTHDKQPVS